MLCTSLIGVYENIIQKVFDPISKYMCTTCKSKRLKIDNSETNENDIVEKLYLRCEECNAITEVQFEISDPDKAQYTKGKIVK